MSSGMIQTQNSILRISDEKTLQLIELYEKEQCLWNTLSDEYKCREKRQKAAERIARRLNLKYFEARHVVIKFKNLRNSYCQELKKIATSATLGLSEDEMYKPKVFWFSKMDSFLRPHLQPTRCGALNVPDIEPGDRIKMETQVCIESCDSNDQSEDSMPTYPVAEHSESVHSDCTEVSEPKSKKRILNYSLASSPKRPRDDSLVHMMRDISNKVGALTEEKKEDYYDTFGKYIASLLRAMPKERAMMLQPQVISLIVSGSGICEGSVSQSDGNNI